MATKINERGNIVIGEIEQGKCPYCGSDDVEYGFREHVDDMIYYEVACKDCGRTFQEWYELKFSGHNVGAGLDIEAKEGMEIQNF